VAGNFCGNGMHTYCFKTNVCSEEYLEKILPHLHDHKEIGNVHVNTESREHHLLTIETSLSLETAQMIVKSAGFEAEPLENKL
jgi:hypothetical protein